MPTRTYALIIILALAGALVGLLAGNWLRPSPNRPASIPGAKELVIGSPRPEATRPDLDGRPQALAQWNGKLVLLNFWATWCAPCVQEMPLLEHAQQTYGERGLQVVGIASDDPQATRAFLRDHPVSYPILIDDPDRDEDLSLIFGDTHNVLPYSVLIGRDGRVLAQRDGNFTQASLDVWLKPHL
jgi:thiol-disulfide isomerase/thioredoxin